MKKTKNKMKIKGIHTAFFIRDGEVIKIDIVENIVTNKGIETMWKKMAGEYSEALRIDKAVLGTGETNPPAITDLELETEVYRNNVISATAEDNIMYVDAYFSQAEVTGTFKEFGYLIDNDVLWNRVAVNWEKEETDALLVRSTFTITNKEEES
jgi:hypothetical protein